MVTSESENSTQGWDSAKSTHMTLHRSDNPEKSASQKLTSYLRKWLHGDELEAVLLRGAGGTFIVKVAGAGLAFAVHVLLARLMEVTQYGIYVYAWSWITLLAVFGKLGMENGFIRFLPEYMAKGQWERFRGLISFGGIGVFLVCSIVAIIAAVVVWVFRSNMAAGQPETIWIALVALPLFGLSNLIRGGLQALKRAARSIIPNSIVRHVLVALGAIGVYLSVDGAPSAESVMGITLVAVLGVVLTGGFFLYRCMPEEAFGLSIQKRHRHWLRVTLPLLFISGMGLLLRRTDILMLGALKGPDAAGIYNAATRISDLAAFGLAAINTIVAPLISELYHSRKREELQHMVKMAAYGSLLIYTLLATPIALLGPYMLNLFGNSFSAGYVPLLILIAGQLVNALSGSVGFVMTMTGHQNQAAVIFALSAIVNILLNIMLIPGYGLIGGAVATATTTIIWNVYMVVLVYKKININTTLFKLRKASL